MSLPNPPSPHQPPFSNETPNSNVFETPAVQNVGDRFSAGGGTQTHTPAIASPKNAKDTSTPHQQKGVGTVEFDEKHMSQRPGEPGGPGKAFRRAHLGNGELR